MTVIETIGITMVSVVIAFNGVALARKWFKSKGQIAYAVCISFLGVLAGIVFVFNERITELTVKGFGAGGTVKAALRGVQSDAKEITEIKDRVLSQRATIDAAFEAASQAHQLSIAATQTVAEAQRVLQEVKVDAEFIRTVEKAKIGFAESWDELKRISVDMTHPRHEEAFNAVMAVMDQYDDYGKTTRPYGRIPSVLNPSTVSLSDIGNHFKHFHLRQQIESVFFVQDQQRFSKAEKLEFFFRCAEKDPNIRVRVAAGFCYMNLAGILDVNPLSWNVISNDWTTNASRIAK